MTTDQLNSLFTTSIPVVAGRLKCKGCNKPRVVEIVRDMSGWQPGNMKKNSEYRIIGWRYKGYGHFCTLTCATFWANRRIDNQ